MLRLRTLCRERTWNTMHEAVLILSISFARRSCRLVLTIVDELSPLLPSSCETHLLFLYKDIVTIKESSNLLPPSFLQPASATLLFHIRLVSPHHHNIALSLSSFINTIDLATSIISNDVSIAHYVLAFTFSRYRLMLLLLSHSP